MLVSQFTNWSTHILAGGLEHVFFSNVKENISWKNGFCGSQAMGQKSRGVQNFWWHPKNVTRFSIGALVTLIWKQRILELSIQWLQNSMCKGWILSIMSVLTCYYHVVVFWYSTMIIIDWYWLSMFLKIHTNLRVFKKDKHILRVAQVLWPIAILQFGSSSVHDLGIMN